MSGGCCGPAAVEPKELAPRAEGAELPVVVIGAGPVGLAAAAHLAGRGIDFLVLEAGDQAGASVARWGHVRTFSPWRFNIDAAARRLLEADGWNAPDTDWPPTGAELIADYLAPLAELLGTKIRLGAKVSAISRLGYDRVRTNGRDDAPFLIRLDSGEELQARAVIDASGTYTSPNVLGGSGLPARGALGTRLRAHVESGRIRLLTGFFTHRVRETAEGVEVISRAPSGAEQSVTVDLIVAATGYRPDHSFAAELRLDLDPILGSTRALAPLIDPNQHSCGTVPGHGVNELSHPEPGYYAVGVKSYGRAPTFLMATGYEQVRSVVAALAGDWEAAREVHLDLPETGVCSSSLAEAQERRVGLATGISGGLLSIPLPPATVDAGSGGGCCG
ncbi:FAD-dependent oxidoreductase [Streptosporangium sp. NPDC000396]|uniref:FAD-dependent oxidoreductase n=1 Tax=Streptosporangium sp. NPDC000396 TaxID=3366185 RepID=UPI00368996A4